jgi:hypothetical protein
MKIFGRNKSWRRVRDTKCSAGNKRGRLGDWLQGLGWLHIAMGYNMVAIGYKIVTGIIR